MRSAVKYFSHVHCHEQDYQLAHLYVIYLSFPVPLLFPLCYNPLTLSNLLMQHELHERMRPWIAKKIIEFLGEEESTLVDYIVSCTKDHVQASKMLELLQSILDVEAEMFVLKMWRMLIFEIKKVETGLSGRAKA